MTPPLPPLLRAYRIGTGLAAPAAPWFLAWRARRGKEDPDRMAERLGRTDAARLPGPLVWVHGASIGETLSVMGVVEALAARGIAVLVTSGTRTAAAILARRLPAEARHQYAPLDTPPAVRRFLDHWRPDLALFAESEIWPNVLCELHARATPFALVNARLSERSAARWARAPAAAAALLGMATLCLAQTEAIAARLRRLGAGDVAVTGNLKFDLPPLPAEPAAAETLASRLAQRTVWLAASTHPGEERSVLSVHRALAERHPGLLTLIAPRHPERGAEIAAVAAAVGLVAGRRSAGDPPDGGAGDVFVVDTVGELGLFYRVAPVVFVGGSLVRHGGQNPVEPARLGAAILHGPHVGNFAEIYAALDAEGAAKPVGEEAGALADVLSTLLDDPARQRAMARASAAVVGRFEGALARTLAALEPLLPGGNRAAAEPP